MSIKDILLNGVKVYITFNSNHFLSSFSCFPDCPIGKIKQGSGLELTLI